MARVIRRRNGKWSSERGSILALSALSMVSVVLAVGVSVDIGHFYTVAAELQSAADAAALSAASALNSGPGGIQAAVDRAINYDRPGMTQLDPLNKYEFNKVGVTIGREDVRFAINLPDFQSGSDMSEATAMNPANAPDIRFVEVTIPPKAVNVFFSVPVLGSTIDITKRAVAGTSVALNYFCNIAPLSVVQDDISGEPLNVNPECPNQTEYTRGCTYTIRLNSGNFVTAGNYLILDLGINVGCGGACEVRRLLARGSQNCYTSESTFATKPGVSAGPVADGINTRFDMYSADLTPAQHPPDKNVMGRSAGQTITYEQYVSGNPAYFQAPPNNPQYAVGDRRVLIIPVMNASEFGNGKTTGLRPHHFGAFFLQESVAASGQKSGEIRAEYMGERAVFGDGGYDPTIAPGVIPSLTVAVLYE